MNLPTGTRGKAVAVALVLIPLLLVVNFIVAPVIGAYTDQSDEIEGLQADIQRYQRVIGELPGLQLDLAQLEQTRPLQPYLLQGNNTAIAAAGLQRRLQEISAENKVRIVSVRIQPAATDGPLERVSVQARMLTSAEGLRALLFELEANQPYLFVENLSLTARPSRRNQVRDEIEIRMNVFGLRQPNAETSPASESRRG